ncbi:hypothetical protein A2164_00550 [Candidatus Curtissbacteria bacterium RBG_13_35_7]|uniref:SLC41A/MgtE integral membrane domain-containing protein n=1 Tax=Candidatus Curtissbacteria bacterium RBG_13_35_7 TaxID=1797705 RepID=A0A1F5G2J7_9BACT|nr:MAG: hypothetical protein A2164_00550 [Candidatus Curtissbacteria bacterium RBG_13_35_7]
MYHLKKQTIDDVMKIPLNKSIKHRLPWLFIGLTGGLFAAHIIDAFDKVLKQNLILAAFIPLIVYMSDAVGTQMEAFAIRDFAIHPQRKFFRYFLKHLLITFTIASILGLFLFLYSFIVYKNLLLGFVLAFSMSFSILSSVVTGLFLPLIFNKLHFDPANASGPIATIIQDILSVIIYFSIASYLL